jgi:hypothetical protein
MTVVFGGPGDIPVLFDFDGDGKADALPTLASDNFRQNRVGLVPAVGIEPTTNGLQNRCSTN